MSHTYEDRFAFLKEPVCPFCGAGLRWEGEQEPLREHMREHVANEAAFAGPAISEHTHTLEDLARVWDECTDAHHRAAVAQGLAFAHPANPYRVTPPDEHTPGCLRRERPPELGKHLDAAHRSCPCPCHTRPIPPGEDQS